MKPALLLLTFCLALGACGTSSPLLTTYELAFEAIDDRGSPIEDIALSVGTTSIGRTDANGWLRVRVNASDGERYPLHAPCPANSRARALPSELVFRDTRLLSGDAQERVSLRIVCERRERVIALMVHADGHEDLPILVDGVTRGHTGPGGFAHLRLDLSPGSQFHVALDSSEKPDLLPRNPQQTMMAGTEDGLYVFDPVFKMRAPKPEPVAERKSRRPRSKSSRQQRKRPVRID